MRVGTVAAMEQLADYFDGYYLQKEHNRNFRVIKELKNITKGFIYLKIGFIKSPNK